MQTMKIIKKGSSTDSSEQTSAGNAEALDIGLAIARREKAKEVMWAKKEARKEKVEEKGQRMDAGVVEGITFKARVRQHHHGHQKEQARQEPKEAEMASKEEVKASKEKEADSIKYKMDGTGTTMSTTHGPDGMEDQHPFHASRL